MPNYYELNLDGLVGPTHHYAGLAPGNIASAVNAHSKANPLKAVLQGLDKMRFLHSLGIKQGILPPHERPNIQLLRQLGFSGSLSKVLSQAYHADPNILSAAFSASSMWTANAATVSPSLDSIDSKVHFTAANLTHNLHRQQEASFSSKLLKTLFRDPSYFSHHPPLPQTSTLGDEGAANHNRLCAHHGSPGIHLFVYGKQSLPAKNSAPHPKRYPARQSLEASQAIARLHQLNHKQVIFVSQNPDAIDEGVFHNDVISVANESFFLVHEQAFFNQKVILQKLKERSHFELTIHTVSHQDIPMKEAVSSYLFNSQIVTTQTQGKSGMALIAPSECQAHPRVEPYLDELVCNPDNPLQAIYYRDLKQSMKNGGGPACLRLKVVLSENELHAMHQGVIITDTLLDTLTAWAHKHYRDRLDIEDLQDPQLVTECYQALEDLTAILQTGSIYPFQETK